MLDRPAGFLPLSIPFQDPCFKPIPFKSLTGFPPASGNVMDRWLLILLQKLLQCGISILVICPSWRELKFWISELYSGLND